MSFATHKFSVKAHCLRLSMSGKMAGFKTCSHYVGWWSFNSPPCGYLYCLMVALFSTGSTAVFPLSEVRIIERALVFLSGISTFHVCSIHLLQLARHTHSALHCLVDWSVFVPLEKALLGLKHLASLGNSVPTTGIMQSRFSSTLQSTYCTYSNA